MQLLLLRHADAATPAATDDERALSEKGVRQARRVAAFCAAHDLVPEMIVTSPIRRAEETARIVADTLTAELTVDRFLSCGMDPDDALSELKAYREFETVMLVGHEPDFSKFAAHLLGLASSKNIRIRKASLTRIEVETFRPGSAQLHFSIPCRLMPLPA